MASISSGRGYGRGCGRGRGRGRGWLQHDTSPLRKSGNPICPEDDNHADIVNLINLVNDENLMEKIDDIAKLVNDKVDEQNLEYCIAI